MSQTHQRHVKLSKECCKMGESYTELQNELQFARLLIDDKENEIHELKKFLQTSGSGKISLSHCDCNENHHHKQNHHQSQKHEAICNFSETQEYQQMADLIEHLRLALQDKENSLIECQERNRFFCQSISRLQEECQSKDALVVELQNEIDKFRQVVKPLTQVFLQHHKADYDEFNSNTIGMESTRVFPSTSEPKRIKRQGYSAEPLTDLVEAEDKLMKIPKSPK